MSDQLTSPSRLEAMKAALFAALDAALPSWTVLRRSSLASLASEIATGAQAPTAAAPLLAILRGARGTADEGLHGGDERLWQARIPVAVYIYDGNADTRDTTLDAAEVLAINAIRDLAESVDFAAYGRTCEVVGSEPVSGEADGDVASYAGTTLIVQVTVDE